MRPFYAALSLLFGVQDVEARCLRLPVDSPRYAHTQASNKAPAPKHAADVVNVLVLDLFATLNAVKYENIIESSQVPQLNAYYNWSVNNILKIGGLSLRTYMFNEYGFCHYFDSLTVKTEDNLRVRNNLQLRLRKGIVLQAGADQRTQLWRKWNRRYDTAGRELRYLYSDYCSPGYSMFSFGISCNFLDGAAVHLGLAGGKITRIRNQRIFDERNANTLYGLDKGQRRKTEWGLNLLLSVPPHLFSRQFGWECSGTVFAPRSNLGRIKSYSAECSNTLHYMFLKHLRLSLRTQVQYDESLQEKVFVANHLSLGFYLSNKL